MTCYHVAIKSNTMNCFFVLFPLRLTPITVDTLGGRFSVCNSKKFVIMGYKRNKHLFCFLTYEIKFPQTRKRSGCEQKISYVHTQLKNGFFIPFFIMLVHSMIVMILDRVNKCLLQQEKKKWKVMLGGRKESALLQ